MSAEQSTGSNTTALPPSIDDPDFRRCFFPAQPSMQKNDFIRLVRDILLDFGPNYSIKMSAIDALQRHTEGHVVSFLGKAYLVAQYEGRETLYRRDIQLARKLLSEMNQESDGVVEASNNMAQVSDDVAWESDREVQQTDKLAEQSDRLAKQSDA